LEKDENSAHLADKDYSKLKALLNNVKY